MVGCGDDVGDPVAARVERGAPGGLLHALGLVAREGGAEDVAGGVHPATRARVGSEHDRPHDAVGEGLAVAVGVIGVGEQVAVT